ncbi:MAG: family 16 glycosylhydrolase [Gammaproteobacteria bacterium]|nr:family 16 glycosylhydrolase [Gammaproteobacteria bacterium]
MRFRSLASLRWAVSLTAVLLVSACTDNDRAQLLSQVETVPPANADTQTNQNINNPTLTIPTTFSVSPGDALTLVWSDEFDGAALDPETWFFATGDGSEVGLPGGWGNNELQYYLPDSAQLEGGVLKITARRETIGGLNYTSARINTGDRFAFQYGRIEASIKLPSGQGLWPAFWMLSQDSPYGIWAATGEIDIVEAVNLDGTGGNEIFATIHYGGEFPANASSSVTYTPGPDVTEGFHTYAMEWDATEIRWYFDGDLYAVQNNWSSTAAPYPAPFDQPFHVLLNLAVGGNFPGNAIDGDIFPATMEVDWVRVYSGEDEPPPPPPPALPVDFENDPVTYDFGMDAGFGGGASDVIANPDMSGINTSAQTARMQKFAGEVFGGSTLALTGDVDFTAGEVFKVKVWASRAVPVLFKFEGLNKERSVDHSGSGGWEELCFDFTADTAGAASNAITFIFDLGVNGDAAGDPDNWTFYFDDIRQTTSCAGGGGGTFVNGNFETGDFTGWTLTRIPNDRGSITLDSSGRGGRAGTVARLVAAGDAAGTNDVLISQVALAAGTVAPGDSIDVSFDLYGSLTGAGGVVFVEVIFLNAAGEDLGGRNFVGPPDPYFPSETWTTHSGTVTAGTAVDGSQWDVSGGVTLQLKAACGAIVGGCGVDASFDNVTFTIN